MPDQTASPIGPESARRAEPQCGLAAVPHSAGQRNRSTRPFRDLITRRAERAAGSADIRASDSSPLRLSIDSTPDPERARPAVPQSGLTAVPHSAGRHNRPPRPFSDLVTRHPESLTAPALPVLDRLSTRPSISDQTAGAVEVRAERAAASADIRASDSSPLRSCTDSTADPESARRAPSQSGLATVPHSAGWHNRSTRPFSDLITRHPKSLAALALPVVDQLSTEPLFSDQTAGAVEVRAERAAASADIRASDSSPLRFCTDSTPDSKSARRALSQSGLAAVPHSSGRHNRSTRPFSDLITRHPKSLAALALPVVDQLSTEPLISDQTAGAVGVRAERAAGSADIRASDSSPLRFCTDSTADPESARRAPSQSGLATVPHSSGRHNRSTRPFSDLITRHPKSLAARALPVVDQLSTEPLISDQTAGAVEVRAERAAGSADIRASDSSPLRLSTDSTADPESARRAPSQFGLAAVPHSAGWHNRSTRPFSDLITRHTEPLAGLALSVAASTLYRTRHA